MPIKQAAVKALRQTKKRRERNLKVIREMKEALKAARKAVGSAEVNAKLRLAQKKIDKAAKKGVIKKNTAGRYLSRLMLKAKTPQKAV